MIITSFGSDPEFIILDQDGNAVSGIPFIPGEKHFPIPIIEEGFSVQKDNVLVEFCVPPSSNLMDVYRNILKAKQWSEENILPEGMFLACLSSANYSDEDLDNVFAMTFGCEPSLNAWSESIMSVKKNKSNNRGAGFHIHFGLEDTAPGDITKFIKLLDITVGVPCVLLDEDIDRRRFYGRAGEFRFTSYGCEYRVLGSRLLESEDNIVMIEAGINRALDLLNNTTLVDELTDEDIVNIQLCINNSDKKLAYDLIKQFELESVVEKTFVID